MLELRFDRELPFAPVIVWDALTDAELVSYWLADAIIDPVVGGEYNLRWLNRLGDLPGRITALRAPEELHIDTANAGLLRFGLSEFEGGSRGTSTRLVLEVDVEVERAFQARVRADWQTNLDQLGDLLHGHPVDWAHWDRDRHEAWTKHYEDAARAHG